MVRQFRPNRRTSTIGLAPFRRLTSQTNLALLFLAMGLVAPIPARADTYGFDIVPPSVFHHDDWNFYGSDPVSSATTHDFGLRTTYGWDPVPVGLVHPHVDHHRPGPWVEPVLLIESVEQLTGAREAGREVKSPEPVRRPAPRWRSLRGWRR